MARGSRTGRQQEQRGQAPFRQTTPKRSQSPLHDAVIGIGSNIRPRKHVALAIAALADEHELVARSRFVKTTPIGPQGQPDFLNGAVRIRTKMNLRQLRKCLRELEARLGRVRTTDKFGPRTIDLDIVIWDGRIIDEDFHTRDFLRRAVREVWANADKPG